MKSGKILYRDVGRNSVPKKLRRPGPKRSEAAAAARKATGLRTYRVTGETESPARRRVLIWAGLANTKRQAAHWRWCASGCA